MSRRTVVAAIGVAAVAAGGALGGVFAVSGSNSSVSLSANSHREHQPREMRMNSGWSFSKLNNSNDRTFNQLLGINNRGQIAGYFGSGAAGHPNKGYVLSLGQFSSSFTNENFPTGVQTQVIGINDTGASVGFWSSQNTKSQTNNNFGFYDWHGQFRSVAFPTRNMANPPVNQLLGVNDSDIAVGFFMGAKGNAHAYAYSIPSGGFQRIRIPGAVSSTASGINNHGDIAGFYTGRGGVTRGFLIGRHGLVRLTVPGASSTMAFGVNDNREVVGTYMVGSGGNAKSFGFIWSRDFGFRTINDPHGSGATTLNGIDDHGDLVGFYTDRKGNTDGLLVAHGHFRAPLAPPVTITAPAPVATPTTRPAPVPTGAGPTHF